MKLCAFRSIDAEIINNPLLSNEIDQLGKLSAEAQHLTIPITSALKLLESDQKQILLCCMSDEDHLVGYVKFGMKHLYFHLNTGKIVECDVMCVLDFYVLEEQQRLGLGKMLFQGFLEHVGNIHAFEVAYDRPSPKLYAFLKRHYNLSERELDFQPNKYAVPVALLQQYLIK